MPEQETETFVLPAGTMQALADFVMAHPVAQLVRRLEQVRPAEPEEPKDD